MRFWDASAVVALCLEEARTAEVDALLRADAGMAACWATPVECASALSRSRRDRRIGPEEEDAALDLLDGLGRAWYEVQPGFRVRAHARRLLRVHPLRAADALQLAAALVWAGAPPSGTIVTLDGRLAEAARLEGLEVLP